jgi:hypothetical protein
MWLLKSLCPDHNTISNFRKNNPAAIKKVFRATVQIAKNFDLIGGKLLAADSSKFRAQNSKKNNYNDKKTIKHASADIGLIFCAYNLRRLFNILDRVTLRRYLRALFTLFYAHLSHFKPFWYVLYSWAPFIHFSDQFNLHAHKRLRLAEFDYFWRQNRGFKTS